MRIWAYTITLIENVNIKQMGEANVILRIKIVRQKDELTFTQLSYIEKILNKLNHFECAPAPTPLSPSIKLIRNKGRIVAQLNILRKWESHVRHVLYETRHSKAMEMLSKNSSNPGKEQWSVMTRVLSYLRGKMVYM